jgi:hypothetical protein
MAGRRKIAAQKLACRRAPHTGEGWYEFTLRFRRKKQRMALRRKNQFHYASSHPSLLDSVRAWRPKRQALSSPRKNILGG